MKKFAPLKKAVYAAVLPLALLLSSCSHSAPPSENNSETFTESPSEKNSENGEVTFTDALGRTVTVNSPKRAAAFMGSFAEIWHLSGGEVTAVPDDTWEDFDIPLSDDTVNLGKINELSLEMLFSADPDFVMASPNIKVNLDWLDSLEDAGITVAYFDVSDFESYLEMLDVCTDITGRKDLYQKNGLDIQKQIENVRKQSEERVKEKGAPTVLSLRASSASIRAKNSEGNVLGEMLHSLGCVNIADSETSLLENLSVEYIIEQDPDFIFFVQVGGDAEKVKEKTDAFIAENPAWNELTAVKEGRVFQMDRKLYNLKPNSRWGEAYEGLEKILSENS